jgi:hypothetical protein
VRSKDDSYRRYAFVLYMLAALIVTSSLWKQLGRQEVAGNPHDTDLYTWWLAWSAHELSSGHLSLITHAMNAPTGVNSMWNTSLILPGAVLAPITLLAGAQASYNVLLIAGFVGSAYTAHRFLLRHANVSWWPAILGGALFGFSPAMVHAALGHVSLEFLVLVPMMLSAVLDVAAGTVRPVIGGFRIGGLAAAQLLIGEEVLFDTAIVTGVLLVVLAVSRRKASIARLPSFGLAMWAGLALFLTVVGYPLWIQVHGPLSQHGSPLLTDYVKSDLLSFVTAPSSVLLHTRQSAATALRISPNREEYLGYLGWPILTTVLVGTIALWRDIVARMAGVMAMITMAFSVGAHLKVNGHQTRVPMPWLLVEHLPLAANVAVARFGLFTPLAAGALLAVVLTKMRSATMGVIVAGVAVLPTIPLPLEAGAVLATPATSITQAADRIPLGSTVLVLPFPTADFTDPLRWQAAAAFRYSMPGGYFIGPAWDGRGYIGGDVPRPTEQLLVQIAGGSHAVQLTAAERLTAATDFSFWHVNAVIVGPGLGQSALSSAMRLLLGQPTVTTSTTTVWLCNEGEAQVRPSCLTS